MQPRIDNGERVLRKQFIKNVTSSEIFLNEDIELPTFEGEYRTK